MSTWAGILVVHGGWEPEEWSWIRLCTERIRSCTRERDYRLYVWNNHPPDHPSSHWLRAQPGVHLTQAGPDETPAHPHADPLQHLYMQARDDGAHFIVTLDSDAFPLRPGWLPALTGVLNDATVLSGVWRDELSRAIEPYVHASCLCVRTTFVEQEGLRFDHIPAAKNGMVQDTLSHFTRTAFDLGLEVHPLRRSNRRNLHRLIGGIYGDLIYHHGAGSRRRISFWDEETTPRLLASNRIVARGAAALLHERYDAYIGWLKGEETSDPVFERRIRRLQAAGVGTGDNGAMEP